MVRTREVHGISLPDASQQPPVYPPREAAWRAWCGRTSRFPATCRTFPDGSTISPMYGPFGTRTLRVDYTGRIRITTVELTVSCGRWQWCCWIRHGSTSFLP